MRVERPCSHRDASRARPLHDGSAAFVGRVMAAILGARREAETFGRSGSRSSSRTSSVTSGSTTSSTGSTSRRRSSSASRVCRARPRLATPQPPRSSVQVGRAQALFGETAAAVAAVLLAAGAACVRAWRPPLRPRPRRGSRLRRPRALDPARRVGARARRACWRRPGPHRLTIARGR